MDRTRQDTFVSLILLSSGAVSMELQTRNHFPEEYVGSIHTLRLNLEVFIRSKLGGGGLQDIVISFGSEYEYVAMEGFKLLGSVPSLLPSVRFSRLSR